MRTITIEGDPESLTSIMVSKADHYKDHDDVRIASSNNGGKDVIKTIFRVVDGGDDKWELQFE